MKVINSTSFKGVYDDTEKLNADIRKIIQERNSRQRQNRTAEPNSFSGMDAFSQVTGRDSTSFVNIPPQGAKTGVNKPLVIGCAVAATAAAGAATVVTLIKTGKLYKLKQKNTIWPQEWGKTMLERMQKLFAEDFVEPLQKGETPQNGFLVFGPDSKGKKQFFDWAISQLKNQGVEVIDTADARLGHSTKESIGAIYDLVDSKSAEQFKKDGKYKLFVVRGMEKIEDAYKSTYNDLRGSTCNSAQNNGLILAYDCLDDINFYSAVTRGQRIDQHFAPQPLPSEDLGIWKNFLEFVKIKLKPQWAAKNVEEAKEIFTKQGPDVLKQMQPHLEYKVPFEVPNFKASLYHWKEYITKSTQKLEPDNQFAEFAEIVDGISASYLQKTISQKHYQAIIDMITENTPADKKAFMAKLVKAGLQQRV